jgi:hypothetical protein
MKVTISIVVGLIVLVTLSGAFCSQESEALAAFQAADVSKLEELVEAGFDFDKLPSEAFDAAVRDWNAEQRSRMMKLSDANPGTFIGSRMRHYTKLLSLVSSGKTEELKKALKEIPFKAEELVDGTGKNLLIWAAIGGASNEILKALVESGINPNHADVAGNTALIWGIISGPESERLRVVACLIEHGADPDLKSNGEPSANELLLSIERRKQSTE